MVATLISEPAHANGFVKPGHSVLHDPSGVLNRMLHSNAQWASDVARVEPAFFEQCAKGQAPRVSFSSSFSNSEGLSPMRERG